MARVARHLVLNATGRDDAPSGTVALACGGEQFVPYDRSRHTYLTRLSTCQECLAVHAAWVVLFKADLGLAVAREQEGATDG